jgi:LPS sulfotransferase NodH
MTAPYIRTIRKDPAILFRKAEFGLASAFGSRDYRRFVILARSRTGSNLLVSLINRHPRLHCVGEIFKDRLDRDLDALMERAFPRYPRRIEAGGVKVFYYHPRDDGSGELWRRLSAIKGLSVIHLKRHNLLRSIVSQRIAQSTGEWRSVDGETSSRSKSVTLPADELRTLFERVRHWERDAEKRFLHHPVLELSYEALAQDMAGTLRQVTDFLQVEAIHPATHLSRQNPEPLSELVGNLENLRDAFSDTEWSWMFDER